LHRPAHAGIARESEHVGSWDKAAKQVIMQGEEHAAAALIGAHPTRSYLEHGAVAVQEEKRL
jgi:hypothetical protein